MAKFTLTELDRLPVQEIQALTRVAGLEIDLPLSVDQRDTMVTAHDSWRTGAALSSARVGLASEMSNATLYLMLRFNEIAFERLPGPVVLSFDDAEAMDDDAIMALAEAGGAELKIDDRRRNELLKNHRAWVEELDDDVREAFDGASAARSDWDIYAEVRINGAARTPAPAASLSA